MSDPWRVYGVPLKSRLLLGTARYPSPQVMSDAIRASETEVVTVSLRRQSPEQSGGESIWGFHW